MPSEKPVRPLHTLAYGETAAQPSAVCTPPAAEILPHTRFAAAWSPCESAMRK